MFLGEPDDISTLLETHLRSESRDDAIIGYQLAFDVVEIENDSFFSHVRDWLPDPNVVGEEIYAKRNARIKMIFCSNYGIVFVNKQGGSIHHQQNSPVSGHEKLCLPWCKHLCACINACRYFFGWLFSRKPGRQCYVHNNNIHGLQDELTSPKDCCCYYCYVKNGWAWQKGWQNSTRSLGLVSFIRTTQKVKSLMNRAGNGLVGPPYLQGGALYALGVLNENDDGKTKVFIMDILKESEIEVCIFHHYLLATNQNKTLC